MAAAFKENTSKQSYPVKALKVSTGHPDKMGLQNINVTQNLKELLVTVYSTYTTLLIWIICTTSRSVHLTSSTGVLIQTCHFQQGCLRATTLCKFSCIVRSDERVNGETDRPESDNRATGCQSTIVFWWNELSIQLTSIVLQHEKGKQISTDEQSLLLWTVTKFVPVRQFFRLRPFCIRSHDVFVLVHDVNTIDSGNLFTCKIYRSTWCFLSNGKGKFTPELIFRDIF